MKVKLIKDRDTLLNICNKFEFSLIKQEIELKYDIYDPEIGKLQPYYYVFEEDGNIMGILVVNSKGSYYKNYLQILFSEVYKQYPGKNATMKMLDWISEKAKQQGWLGISIQTLHPVHKKWLENDEYDSIPTDLKQINDPKDNGDKIVEEYKNLGFEPVSYTSWNGINMKKTFESETAKYCDILNEIAATFDMDQWDNPNIFEKNIKDSINYLKIYIPAYLEEYISWKDLILDICNKLYKNKTINKLINTTIPSVYRIVHNFDIPILEILETPWPSTSNEWKTMPVIIKKSIKSKLLKNNKINPDIDFNTLENISPSILLNNEDAKYYSNKPNNILQYTPFIFDVYAKSKNYDQNILDTIISELNLYSLDNIINNSNTMNNSKTSIINWCITKNNEPILLMLTNNTWDMNKEDTWKLIVAIPWLFI